MGTIGADCPRVARVMTPGPLPQPHGWERLGLEVSRFLHFWGGVQGMCPSSIGCGVSGSLALFFSPHPYKKSILQWLAHGEATSLFHITTDNNCLFAVAIACISKRVCK